MVYCSSRCRLSVANIGRPIVERKHVGTLSLMMVCTDLVKRGYEVFTAISPHGVCDAVAIKGRLTLRIEVTTGTYYAGGTVRSLQYPPHQRYADQYDTLAVVVQTLGEIHYFGQIP